MLIKLLGVVGILAVLFFGIVVFDLSGKQFAILALIAAYMVVAGYLAGINEESEKVEALEKEIEKTNKLLEK